MSNVTRPPFWVPRPLQETYWAFQPPGQRSFPLRLLTEQKFFGQGGQVPQKRWSFYDETGFWSPTIDDLNVPASIIKFLTPQFIETPGATLNWNFLVDDAPVFWSRPSPKHLLVTQVIFSQHHVRFDATLRNDDTAPWRWTPPPPQQVTPTAPVVPVRWNSYDETSTWQRTISPQPPQVQQAPFSPIQFGRTYDETPAWQRTASSITQGQPFSLRVQYPRTFDEAAPWQRTITFPLVQFQRPFIPTRPQSTGDETPWQRTIATQPPQVQQNPFSYRVQYARTYDETAPWLAASSRNGAIVTTTSQAAFYGQQGQAYPFRWNATLDDPPPRLTPPSGQNNGLFATLVPPPPFANTRPLWRSLDDPPAWQRTAQDSQPIALTTLQIAFYGQPGQAYPFRWNATQDDPPVWTWPPQSWNKNALLQVSAPLVHPPATFYSEDAIWVGTPVARNTFVQQTAPLVHPQPWFYAESSFWQGSPVPYVPIPAPIPLKPFRPNWTQDDPPFWAWPPQGSHSAFLTTTQVRFYGQPGQTSPRFWSFNYDDQSRWWSSPLPSRTNFLTITPPPPLPTTAGVVYALVQVTVSFSTTLTNAWAAVTQVAQSLVEAVTQEVTAVSTIGAARSSSVVSAFTATQVSQAGVQTIGTSGATVSAVESAEAASTVGSEGAGSDVGTAGSQTEIE